MVQQIVEAGQQESEGRAARQQRQRLELLVRNGAHPPVSLQHEPRLGDVEGAVRLETPGIETDRQVVREEVIAGEIEIDQARELVGEEEDVVGKEVGMDHAGRQVFRPGLFQVSQLFGEFVGQALLDLVGARRAGFEQRTPARDREIVLAAEREVCAGQVHLGHGVAQFLAVRRQNAARPEPVQEGDDNRRPAAELAQGLSVAALQRRRAADAASGEVVQESEEIGQVLRTHALLVEGHDVAALGGAQQVVGVLHPFGDAFEGGHLAKVVVLQEGLQILVENFGVDGHGGIVAGLGFGRWLKSLGGPDR